MKRNGQWLISVGTKPSNVLGRFRPHPDQSARTHREACSNLLHVLGAAKVSRLFRLTGGKVDVHVSGPLDPAHDNGKPFVIQTFTLCVSGPGQPI